MCDRFRIVLLCKQFFPNAENNKTAELEYKEIYRNICDYFNLPYDPTCVEPSRFYWIPEESKTDLIISKGRLSQDGKGVPLDLRYFIKNIKMRNNLESISKKFNSSKYWKAAGIKTMLEKTISNAIITGQRNNSLLVLALNLMDYGLGYDDIKNYIYDVDSKFPDSIGSLQAEGNEIDRTILSTLEKRMIDKGIYPNGKNKPKENVEEYTGMEFTINENYDIENSNENNY
jgi:hypothetical protein